MKARIKPRRYDLNADEFLAAVAGEMLPAELGVYWMICLLHYSHREPIKNDMKWLRGKFKSSHGLSIVDGIVESLISCGKVERNGTAIGVRRVSDEIAIAQRRVSDAIAIGKRGGRPSHKSNGLEKGSGSFSKNPTSTTTSTKRKKSPSSSVGEVAARASSLSGGATRAHDLEPGKWKPLGNGLGHPTASPPPPSEDHQHFLRQQQHMQFLLARGSPGELALYNDAQMSDDPEAARRMFDLTEARIAQEEHNV